MGWLFAVALGLQERSARAVWRALLPLSLGHALAIVVVVVPAAVLGLVLPPATLKWLVAGALLTFALYRIWRRTHPHWGGMQVGFRDLTIWSLLMATAHGAGLMVLPMLLPPSSAPTGRDVVHASPMPQDHEADHASHLAATGPAPARMSGLAAAIVHTLGYLLMTGLIALVVYTWAGLRLLRRAWINVDLLWIAALIVTAIITPSL
jgi:hypothetical protein